MTAPKYVISSLVIAGAHFAACGILAAIVLPASFGYALYDTYQSPAWWLVAADHALLFLEAPVVLVLYWLYHPAARFEPPHYFAADFLSNGSNVLMVFGSCILWSLALGCLVACVKGWMSRRA
ncbi:MAG TPA: hypothetical protein VMF08_21885 [Candidatus Sulfotelmatobacter sp.]|nr:hypothetical protein [Candidatus Sulfotelmatobacter sp.]